MPPTKIERAPTIITLADCSQQPPSKRLLVLSVDFGTTYISVCHLGLNGHSNGSSVSFNEVGSLIQWSTSKDAGSMNFETPAHILYTQDKPTLRYGFDVYQDIDDINHIMHENAYLYIDCPKIWLDRSVATIKARSEMRKKIARLMESLRIDEENDIVLDILVRVLEHTWAQLHKDEEAQELNGVEFVLPVPGHWTASSRHQASQLYRRAIQITLGNEDTSYEDFGLFLVSELEAGATYLLEEMKNYNHGKGTYLIVDAGGGTIDVGIYMHDFDGAPRFTEVTQPTSASCGSHLLNIAVRDYLTDVLSSGAPYLAKKNAFINQAVKKFEFYIKPEFSWANAGTQWFKIPGLRPDENFGFEDGKLKLSVEQWHDIWDPIMKEAKNTLEEQVQCAESAGHIIEHVVILGGFGLHIFIKDLINDIFEGRMSSPKITTREKHVSAVARGAILRALNKNGGPQRTLQCSIGFIRDIPFRRPDPMQEIRARIFKERPPPPGRTVHYFFQHGDILDPNMPPVKVTKQDCRFSLRKEEWICEQVLCFSESKPPSGLSPEHPKNIGLQVLATMTINLCHLRNLIKIRKGENDYLIQVHFSVRFHPRSMYKLILTASWDCRKNGKKPKAARTAADDEKLIGTQEQLVDITALFPPGAM